MSQRLVILDGSSLMYRAFFALPLLEDSRGEPTNAIVGFSNMLTKLMEQLEPDAMVLAFDKSRKTFRTEKYAAYKGTRDKAPEELLSQIPLLRLYAAAFGISFIEIDNYEADDIIGTLAAKAAAVANDVMVVTGDRDALQLVRPNLKVLLTKKGISEMKEYDEKVFWDEYGFEPIKLIDLKSLMGDKSDNIPGVPGVGPKTAAKLLLKYGSLETVLANIADISGNKLKTNLLENKDKAILSKELATIELAVPNLEFNMAELGLKPNHSEMKKFCERYELKSVWRNFTKLYGEASAELTLDFGETAAVSVDVTYENWDAKQAKAILTEAQSIALAGIFAGKAPFEKLAGMAVYTLPLGKLGFVEAESAAWQILLACLEHNEYKTITLYDLKRYYHAGLKPKANFFDIEIADYLLHPDFAKHDLTRLSQKYFPQEAIPDEFVNAAEAMVWEAKLLGRLQGLLTEKLTKLGLTKLYDTMELPLVEVLAAMEQNGIYVNRERLKEKAAIFGEKISQLEKDIYTLAGVEFNVKSPKQLGEVLFEKLNLPPIKKTKTGYSTNAEVLNKLRNQHPVIEQILNYRTLTKLKSTYLDAIGEIINPESGRVHTSFNQTVTATGRLSSSDPNLQNIPVRTEEGRSIRTLFEPGAGYDVILSADYSQIELRLLAHMSGDESFIDAFKQNQDIHARTAAEVFGVPLAEVTSDLRRKAKAVNFGIVYGISDYGLAQDLNILPQEAGSYIKNYFLRYPGVKKFLDETVAAAHENGYVTTLFGRRRDLAAINSRNFMQRSLAERMAMNTPIQGTAADIIKLAMIAAYKKLKAAKVKSRILIQVHDELVLEVKNDELTTVKNILHETMEDVVKLAVPLIIDIHSGKNWAEAK